MNSILFPPFGLPPMPRFALEDFLRGQASHYLRAMNTFKMPLSPTIPIPIPKIEMKTESEVKIEVKLEELSHRKDSFSPSTQCSDKKKDKRLVSEEYRSTKNIPKNFGKAIATFGLNKMALPYIETIIVKEGVTMAEFTGMMKLAKKTIRSIDSFRSLLLINDTDAPLLVRQKKAFQAISIIFVKYFSVNWIIHSRLDNKMVYLKHRSKMLRRIENPITFTYLKPFKGRDQRKLEQNLRQKFSENIDEQINVKSESF